MASANSVYVNSLVSFILDTKPYSSKLTDIVEEYQFYDNVNVDITEHQHTIKASLNTTWKFNAISNGIRTQFKIPPYITDRSAVNIHQHIFKGALDETAEVQNMRGAYRSVPHNRMKKVLVDNQVQYRAIDYHISQGIFSFDTLPGRNWIQHNLAQLPSISGRIHNGINESVSLTGEILTVTSISSTALSQTWTLTATSPTTFSVVGSVTGPTIMATVGLPYNNGQIRLTIPPISYVVGDVYEFYVENQLATITNLDFAPDSGFDLFGFGVRPFDENRTLGFNPNVLNIEIVNPDVPSGSWEIKAISATEFTVIENGVTVYPNAFADIPYTNVAISFRIPIDALNPSTAPFIIDDVFTFDIIRPGALILPDPIRLTRPETWSLIKVDPLCYSYPDYRSAGQGYVTPYTITNLSSPTQDWELTAISSTEFTIVGSVSGAFANATVGTLYDNGLISFTIFAASNPSLAFIAGDKFKLEVINLAPTTSNVFGNTLALNAYDTVEFDNFPYDSNPQSYVLPSIGLTILSTSIEEAYWELEATSATVFTVTERDLVTNAIIATFPNATVDVPYNNGKVSFTITTPSTPFVTGEIISFVVYNTPPYFADITPPVQTINRPFLSLVSSDYFNNGAETWTITATSSNEFTVVGSVSGAQANAFLDVPYRQNIPNYQVVAFTIVSTGSPITVGDTIIFDIFAEKPSYLVFGSVSGWFPPVELGVPYDNGFVAFNLPKPRYALSAFNTPTIADGITYRGDGNGTFVKINPTDEFYVTVIDPTAVPASYFISATAVPTVLSVYMYVDGIQTQLANYNISTGLPYVSSTLTFKIVAGSIPFSHGDLFSFNTKDVPLGIETAAIGVPYDLDSNGHTITFLAEPRQDAVNEQFILAPIDYSTHPAPSIPPLDVFTVQRSTYGFDVAVQANSTPWLAANGAAAFSLAPRTLPTNGTRKWSIKHGFDTDNIIVSTYIEIPAWTKIIPNNIKFISKNEISVNFTSPRVGTSCIAVPGPGSFIHEQTTASDVWTIDHELNSFNLVNAVYKGFGSNKQLIRPQSVTMTNVNQIVVTFTSPITGSMVLLPASKQIVLEVLNPPASSFTYASSSQWVVNHNLRSKNLIFSIYNSSNVEVMPQDIIFAPGNEENTITITFITPVAGRIVLRSADYVFDEGQFDDSRISAFSIDAHKLDLYYGENFVIFDSPPTIDEEVIIDYVNDDTFGIRIPLSTIKHPELASENNWLPLYCVPVPAVTTTVLDVYHNNIPSSKIGQIKSLIDPDTGGYYQVIAFEQAFCDHYIPLNTQFETQTEQKDSHRNIARARITDEITFAEGINFGETLNVNLTENLHFYGEVKFVNLLGETITVLMSDSYATRINHQIGLSTIGYDTFGYDTELAPPQGASFIPNPIPGGPPIEGPPLSLIPLGNRTGIYDETNDIVARTAIAETFVLYSRMLNGVNPDVFEATCMLSRPVAHPEVTSMPSAVLTYVELEPHGGPISKVFFNFPYGTPSTVFVTTTPYAPVFIGTQVFPTIVQAVPPLTPSIPSVPNVIPTTWSVDIPPAFSGTFTLIVIP